MIVCLEGVYLCGKTTQCTMLAKSLRSDIVSFYTGGNNVFGDALYARFADAWKCQVNPNYDDVDIAELNTTVFMALSHAERYSMVPKFSSARDEGTHIICDSFWQTGYVLSSQFGKGSGVYLDFMSSPLTADINILLDVSEDTIAHRAHTSSQHFDMYGNYSDIGDKFRKLWDSSLDTNSKCSWAVVNGENTVDQVHADIIKVIENYADSNIATMPYLPWRLA